MTSFVRRFARHRSLLTVAALTVAAATGVAGCAQVATGAAADATGQLASRAATSADHADATATSALVYQPLGEAAARRSTPKIKHVFVINMENESSMSTYGAASVAPYVAKTLRSKAVFLSGYDGVAHNSLPNYIAEISGQGPNTMTQADCQNFMDFARTATVGSGQAVGQGCVYPADVPSLPVQMTKAHRSWKGYMDDMKTSCQHPVVNQSDNTQKATPTANYAARHNPFMYFHGVIDNDAYCKAHVVPLTKLPADLKKISTTPNLTYITPDLCNDGHDAPCADGRAGGLHTVNTFMKSWVPKILASPAFKADGMLVITTDESEVSDTAASGGSSMSVNTPQAGITGPGGGNIGTLVISRFARPGSVSRTPYNHYSLLGSIETIFGLSKIGYAATVTPFGRDVYNAVDTRPVARIAVKPSSKRALRDHQVRFVAVGSYDKETPRGLRFSWNFHDGGTHRDARGPRVSHHWGRPGRHLVTLAVTDGSGLRGFRTVVVVVTRR